MNLLNKLERYIKRPVLAQMIETNETYLSVLAKKKELTEEMEERLRKAGVKVLVKLEKVLDEE